MTPDEEYVIATLDRKPSTIAELAAWTHLPRRVVERAIQRARLEGKPIASDERGVWLTDDPAELRATEVRLVARLSEQRRTTLALARTRRRIEQPRVLFPELA